MMNYDKLGLAVGAIGIAFATYMHIRTSKIASKLDMAVNDLADRASVDVSDAIVDKAVQRAVDREVSGAVSLAASTAVRRVSSEMEAQIRQSVNSSYSDLEKSVSGEIARQVSRLDITQLKKDVTEQAKAAVLEKFDGSLDDVLSDFNKNLQNVSKIYGSIADSLTKKQEKEMVFKIGTGGV